MTRPRARRPLRPTGEPAELAALPVPRVLPDPVDRQRATAVCTGPAAAVALHDRLTEALAVAAPTIAVVHLEVEPVYTAGPARIQAQERLLFALALRLASVTQPTDLVVRPQPRQFVLILDNVSDAEAMAVARRRIGDVFAQPVLLGGRPVKSSANLGLVLAEAGDSPEALLVRAAADAAAGAGGRSGLLRPDET